MTTYDASWSGILRVIGELERIDHWHLTETDDCAFLGEYTPRKGYSHSQTNQIITNLKKSPELRNSAQWPWKLRAVVDVAACLSGNLNADNMHGVAVVPMPPSKPPGHPLYDDRMAQVARRISPPVDVREVLFTREAREALHTQDSRRDYDALQAGIGVCTPLLMPVPRLVILLDDMLTTGCTFAACKAVLRDHWPDVEMLGLFVARRVPERFDPSVFLDDLDVDF
ncbi:MAG: hypothetical protein B7Z15_04065 [Rhizobiales bacterium 32-66-8]|nr:MAG: hypothetical protein B7Z15_04065 [Rhizobiales bacterium 32-66-8]